MIESKARNETEDPEVLAKRDAAVLWCRRASDHAATYDGKHRKYLLIPHDAIAENMTASSRVAAITRFILEIYSQRDTGGCRLREPRHHLSAMPIVDLGAYSSPFRFRIPHESLD